MVLAAVQQDVTTTMGGGRNKVFNITHRFTSDNFLCAPNTTLKVCTSTLFGESKKVLIRAVPTLTMSTRTHKICSVSAGWAERCQHTNPNAASPNLVARSFRYFRQDSIAKQVELEPNAFRCRNAQYERHPSVQVARDSHVRMRVRSLS